MELPKPGFQMEYPKLEPPKKGKGFNFVLLIVILIAFLTGIIGGIFISNFYPEKIQEILSKLKIEFPYFERKPSQQEAEKIEKKEETVPYLPQTSQEEAIIKVVQKASSAVVSVIITKDIPKLQLYYEEPFKEFEEFFGIPFEFKIPQWKQEGYEKQEIGGGTAFFISEDGLLLTNAHVVSDKDAEYTVLTNDGKKYPAKVLARDKMWDLAILKVEGGPFPTLKLGDSDKLQIGQTVIAIGNALGEFRNTVSVGVISGLGRTITVSGEGIVETIEDVIQTDAAINRGNSGGPLLNLKGEVIGVNFAMASQAENIGFAIPINKAKKDIELVKKFGKIVLPYLGVWYWNLDEDLKKEVEEKIGIRLPVSYGAWITRWSKDSYGHWYLRDIPAVVPGTPAEKAGLKEGDIILELNNEKITAQNKLGKIIMKYNPGDKVILKVLRNNKELVIEVVLGERSAE